MAHQDQLDPNAEYYQTAQYTCLYNARDGSVACKPFVRTFLKTAQTMSEITPVVNRGGRLPKTSHLQVKEDRDTQSLEFNER
ncbi:hypothetical protein JCM5353_002006 [Sporobolomyces roseus]